MKKIIIVLFFLLSLLGIAFSNSTEKLKFETDYEKGFYDAINYQIKWSSSHEALVLISFLENEKISIPAQVRDEINNILDIRILEILSAEESEIQDETKLTRVLGKLRSWEREFQLEKPPIEAVYRKISNFRNQNPPNLNSVNKGKIQSFVKKYGDV